MPDIDDLSATAAAATGTDQATPPAAPTETTAPATGTEQVTPASETTTGSLPTGERNADDLLTRAVTPNAQPQAPKPPVIPAAQPALPPDIQAALDGILKDPEQAKRLVHMNKHWGQMSNELGTARKQLQQWDGLDPQQVRQTLAQQQEQARQAKLNAWNRGHPDHSKFQQVRFMWQRDQKRLEGVDPANRPAVKAALDATYSPEERQMLDGYEQWRQAEDSMSPEEREDRMRESVRAEVMQAFQSYERYQGNVQATNQFMTQNAELIGKHAEVIEWATTNPHRREVAVELARLKAENEALRARKVGEAQEVETARARDALTQQRSTVRRDSSTVSSVDRVEQAKKLGLTGDKLWDFLNNPPQP